MEAHNTIIWKNSAYNYLQYKRYAQTKPPFKQKLNILIDLFKKNLSLRLTTV